MFLFMKLNECISSRLIESSLMGSYLSSVQCLKQGMCKNKKRHENEIVGYLFHTKFLWMKGVWVGFAGVELEKN